MASNIYLANATAQTMLSALDTFADVGAAWTIKIYSGAQPTDADTAIGAQVLLATLTASADGFGAVSDGTGKATMTANAITSDSAADATGTAAWFRMANGTPATVLDGTVGSGGTYDIVFNTVSFVAGATISISSLVIDLPEH